jgi:hypothetical protein
MLAPLVTVVGYESASGIDISTPHRITLSLLRADHQLI